MPPAKLCLFLGLVACDASALVAYCPYNVVEISVITAGPDGVHDPGEQCYVTGPGGSIDYNGCCPVDWHYLALGNADGILCEQDIDEACPYLIEVRTNSPTNDGVSLPGEDCTVETKDGGVDFNGCCPTDYHFWAIGPDLTSVICEESP